MSSTIAEVAKSPESFFLELHKKYLEDRKPASALEALNRAAAARFEQLKFPHSKHDMYTFVNTKDLVETPFELDPRESVSAKLLEGKVYPGCENSVITLVNGVYQADLSNISGLDSSVKLICLEDAISDQSINEYLQTAVENENDVFASLNSAFLNSGLLIEVAPKSIFESPLQILHISTGSPGKPQMTHPRVFLKVGTLAEAKVIVRYVGAGGDYLVNSVLDVVVEEDASVTFSQVQEDAKDSWHFSKSRISLARNSRFIAANASAGCRLARHHYEINLKETGSEMQLNGVSVLVEKEQVHNYIRVHHEAPECNSNQHFKNIVNDEGRSSFDGTVTVHPGAQLTNSGQLINNLLLSDQAHADNKPNLMIYADDVKCTHGATVGQINDEQMFYLKTRGLSEHVAKLMLTKSFAESIIDTIPFPEVVKDLNQTLLKKLEANHG